MFTLHFGILISLVQATDGFHVSQHRQIQEFAEKLRARYHHTATKERGAVEVNMPTPDYSVDLDLGEPSQEVMEYARQHCGEDPNTRLQAIYELREMIYERGECSPSRMDDEYLTMFLRARKFIPQRAHRLMVNYHQFREDYPELFENIYPLDMHNIGDANIIAVPPYNDQDGRRLLLYRIGCWDPKVIPVEDLFKGTIFAFRIGLLEQRSQILGGVAIFDLEDLGSQHVWQVTPAVAAKMIKLLVSCSPMSTHAIHVVNHSWLFNKIYNIFKPLLNKEMRSKIYFHGYDFSSLHEHINPENLPERYGGVWPDYSYTIWLQSLRKNYEVAKKIIASGYKFREGDLDAEVERRLKNEGIVLDYDHQ